MLKLASCSLALASVALLPVVAAAHCCHDERLLGAQQQSEFRRGLHGLGDGVPDDAVQSDPPSVGGGLRRGPGSMERGGAGSLGDGGIGSMHGGGIGSYGGGSVGEPAPGGLGSLRNGGLGPQAPRPR